MKPSDPTHKIKRKHRERPPLVTPFTLSQITSEDILGINDRRYLETVAKHRGALSPVKLGKLVITRVAAWDALLAQLAESGEGIVTPEAPSNEATPDAGAAGECPTDPDAVLARLGRRRVG